MTLHVYILYALKQIILTIGIVRIDSSKEIHTVMKENNSI